MNRKVKRKLCVRKIIFLLIICILVIASILYYFKIKDDSRKKALLEKEQLLKQELIKQEQLKNDIINHYSKYVKTIKQVDIYTLENGQYIKNGIIGQNQLLELKQIDITYKDNYFPIETFDGYYIFFEDVEIIDNLEELNQRYKNYIPYNENIITKEITNFYDLDDNLVYSFNKSFDLEIIIKDDDKYGLEFNNRLLYIKKEDVKETHDNFNNDEQNTESIAVLNYHFFYDADIPSERKECDQTICLSTQMFSKHLDYIKDNHIFTPTLEEFEMYLDQKIQLPKSVVITIDDGWRSEQGVELLERYELNGTVFLITVYHAEVPFLHAYKYVEYHSHGDNLHNQGDCPGGQGGAIKCKDKEYLLNDLKISSEKLGGSKYFCYPFYEYNNYSIDVLKDAGFTMAFAGGGRRAYIGVDKYQIPRFAIQYYDTEKNIANYIGQ